MRLLITRHGQTIENKAHTVMGWLPGHLSSLGKEQARMLALRLKDENIDIIFCSDLDRARDTAKIIARYHKNASFLENNSVRERYFGKLQGKSSKDIDWNNVDNNSEFGKIYGCESIAHVRLRASRFYKMLLRKYADKTVLIVTHAFLKTVLLGVIQKIPLKESLKVTDSKNASISEFLIDKDGKHKIIYLHCTKHLDT
jgi:broad specificity phosphatase PhoE